MGQALTHSIGGVQGRRNASAAMLYRPGEADRLISGGKGGRGISRGAGLAGCASKGVRLHGRRLRAFLTVKTVDLQRDL